MSNTEKFTGIAQTYAAYRPAYPESMMDYLYTEVGFTSESAVADVGEV